MRSTRLGLIHFTKAKCKGARFYLFEFYHKMNRLYSTDNKINNS